MSDFGLSVDDTSPVLDLTLTDSGSPIDAIPGGSTARLHGRDVLGALVLDVAATIDADQTGHPGHVTYAWQAADTATAADLACTVVLTKPDGSVQTFPEDDAITVLIEAPVARYSTVRALRDRLAPAGSQRTGQSAALLGATQLDGCIARAQSEIDARLAGRYFVPFNAIPPGAQDRQVVPSLVVDITLDLAAWYATLEYRRSDLVTADDPSRLRANAAETLLAQLVAGQAVLLGAAPAVTPSLDTDVSDPVVVNQDWHTCDLTDPRQLRHVPHSDQAFGPYF